MRERVTKIFSCLFIASSLLVILFPFFIVKADNNYISLTANTPVNVWVKGNGNIFVSYSSNISEVRAIVIKWINQSGTTMLNYSIVSEDAFTSTSYGASGFVSKSYSYNGSLYAITHYGDSFDSVSNIYVNYLDITNLGNIAVSTYVGYAIDYTFGAHAEPEGPEWGGPANVMYNTRISGTGQMASQNIDRIVFSPDIDSNGNILPDNARFQIRAVPLEYSGLTPTDVLSKTYSQAILNYTDATVLMDRIPANGVYEVKWSEVAETLSIPFSTVNSVIQGDDYFYKMGWIYEIRLQIGDYYSDWEKIYTATSSGAQVEEDISNSDTMSQQLIQNIAIVNNLNETTVNWFIQETEINMTEYDEPGQGEKPWWAYLLEAIVSSFNITNNYINEGNDTTINISNTVNNSDDDMNNKINQYQQYEDDFIQDMDDNLTDIDTDVPLLSNSKFVNSAQWVAHQYNRMTNNTVIGSLLGFSLVFGLALIFIGRIR